MIHAITFDFWNTLFVPVRADDVRAPRIKATLEQSGHRHVGLAQIEQTVPLVWQDWERAWIQERRTIGAEEWVARLLHHLGVTIEPGEQEALTHAMALSGMEANPPLVDGLSSVLPRLAKTYRLGVICDTGLSPGWMLRDWMEAHGILSHFAHQTFSDELGVSKPHPDAFLVTLAKLGVSPGHAVHIGDYPRTDIAGAQGVGMRAIRFTGVVDWTGDGQASADAEIASYSELEPLLGKWAPKNGA